MPIRLNRRKHARVVRQRPHAIVVSLEVGRAAARYNGQIQKLVRYKNLTAVEYQDVLAYVHNFRLKHKKFPRIDILTKVFPKLG